MDKEGEPASVGVEFEDTNERIWLGGRPIVTGARTWTPKIRWSNRRPSNKAQVWYCPISCSFQDLAAANQIFRPECAPTLILARRDDFAIRGRGNQCTLAVTIHVVETPETDTTKHGCVCSVHFITRSHTYSTNLTSWPPSIPIPAQREQSQNISSKSPRQTHPLLRCKFQPSDASCSNLRLRNWARIELKQYDVRNQTTVEHNGLVGICHCQFDPEQWDPTDWRNGVIKCHRLHQGYIFGCSRPVPRRFIKLFTLIFIWRRFNWIDVPKISHQRVFIKCLLRWAPTNLHCHLILSPSAYTQYLSNSPLLILYTQGDWHSI